MEDLNGELKEMRALVEELHSALRAEQAEKSSLQVKPRVASSEGAWSVLSAVDFTLHARRTYLSRRFMPVFEKRLFHHPARLNASRR